MSELDFDPIDLAMLGAGWAQGADMAAKRGDALTIEHADLLLRVAKDLTELYRDEVDGATWTGVWAYEVAEPLGFWIGEQMALGRFPSRAEIKDRARVIVNKAMATA